MILFELVKRVYNRKDRETVDALRKYQTVYNTPEGRWVLEDILSMCHYGDSCLGKTTDETYFKMGEHNIGVEIAQRINADIVKLEEQSKKEEMSTDVHNQE